MRWLCFSGFVEEVQRSRWKVHSRTSPWVYSGRNRIFAGHLGFSPVESERVDTRSIAALKEKRVVGANIRLMATESSTT